MVDDRHLFVNLCPPGWICIDSASLSGAITGRELVLTRRRWRQPEAVLRFSTFLSGN